MIEGINAYQNNLSGLYPGLKQGEGLEDAVRTSGLLERAATARSPEEKQRIKEEFLAVFYKAMLKQSIKPPNFSGEENNNSVGAAFTADVLLEQLAIKLSASAQMGASVLE